MEEASNGADKPLRVLIVCGERDYRDALKLGLSLCGGGKYVVSSVATLADALASLATHPADCVLFEFQTDRLPAIKELRAVTLAPVIALGDAGQRAAALAQGAYAFAATGLTPLADLSDTIRAMTMPDGPFAPNRVYYHGRHCELPPIPWRLLDLLWDYPALSFAELNKSVWGGAATAKAIGVAVARCNEALLELGVPWTLAVRSGHVAKSMTPWHL